MAGLISPAPVMSYVAPAPAVIAAPSPPVEYLALAPAVVATPAPVIEGIAPAQAEIAALAPVEKCTSQQLLHVPVLPLVVEQRRNRRAFPTAVKF